MKQTIISLYPLIEKTLCVLTVFSIVFHTALPFYLMVMVLEIGYMVFMRTYFNKNEFETMQIIKYGKIFLVCETVGAASAVMYRLQTAAHTGSVGIMILPVAIVGLLAAYGLYNKSAEKDKEFEEVIDRLMGGEEKTGNMDVVICRDYDTNEPVKWMETDRYLHCLIIGATGSGKTSQILLPMLYQDIQKDSRSIIVLEPKGDLAEKVYAMATIQSKKALYFNPIHPDCPSFNPFYGDEDVVVENTCRIFNALNKSNNMYFQVMAETLLRNGLAVIKRIEKASVDPRTGIPAKPATMIRFSNLIHNSSGEGVKMVKEFKNISNISPTERKNNADIASWFLDSYFVGGNAKEYQDTSIVRAQFVKLTSNPYLRRVLNPDTGLSDIRFDQIIEDDVVLAIGTAQGILQDLGAYLGYFIMLSYEAAVLRRKGTEETRKPNIFICDEFQKYADIGFSDVLTQGRSYRVSAVLATQSRKQITMNMDAHEGAAFLEVVSTNCRNTVLFPGSSIEDVEYFSKKFGTVVREQVTHGKSRPNTGLFSFGNYSGGSNSESYRETEEAEHSIDSLMFKDFGQIAYQLVKKNTLQRAKIGRVEWIPKDINAKIKDLVDYYAESQEKKLMEIQEQERREQEERNRIVNNPIYQANGGEVDALD